MAEAGRRAAVGALAVVGAGGFAVPAQAHPFGDPQTVEIALDPARSDVVRVQWKVGGLDDLTLLGVSLGLVPKERVMLDGAVFYQDSDGAAIGPSEKFAAYLLKQITVASDGKSCTGAVEPPTDVAKTGAAIAYTCPGPVGTAKVSVRTLTDLSTDYRTLATGSNGNRAVYAVGQDSYDWAFVKGAEAPRAERNALLQIAIVVAAVLLIAIAAAVVARRRRAVA